MGNTVFEEKEIFVMRESGVDSLDFSALPKSGILIICQFSGSLEYKKSGIKKILRKGECLVADLANGYSFKYSSRDENRSGYAIFGGELVNNILQHYDIQDGCVVLVPEMSVVLDKVRKVTGSSISEMISDPNACALYFHEIAVYISKAKRAIDKESRGTAFLIKNYIESNIEGKLTLQDVSKMFFISKTQIFRIFKDAYGIPPMQYYLQKKIELSKQMLENTDMHISEIADALSFTDSKHFTKTFKKIVGELPRNYRRAMKAPKNQ